MSATPLALGHPKLVGFKIHFNHWIFAARSFQPSYWLILKREGFSGDLMARSGELEDLSWYLDRGDLAAIYRLHDTQVPDYFWTHSVRIELAEIILAGDIQVFKVDADTADRLASYCDPIYSNPRNSDSIGELIVDQRNALAETLGQDITTRWMGKDKADRLHWHRHALLREVVESYDTGKAVVDTVANFVVSLWDIGKLIVTIAKTQITFTFNAAVAAAEYQRKLITGEIKPEDVRQDLEALGITIGDLVNDGKKLMGKAEEGLKILQRIGSDPLSRELLYDYLDSLYQSIHYRNTRSIEVKIVSEFGIEVLLALATGGAATIARRAAQAAAKGTKPASKAQQVTRIGPFPAQAIDEMVDLAKRLDKPEIKIDKPPVTVIPEDVPGQRGNGGSTKDKTTDNAISEQNEEILDEEELSFEDALILAGDTRRAKIVSEVGNEVQPALDAIRKLDPNVQVGFRGSLASGLKNPTKLGPGRKRVAFDGFVETKNGQPFTGEQGFDLDFFVVSDELASQFNKKVFFKDITRLDSSLKPVFNDLSNSLNKNPALQGLKQENVVFRVFNSSQMEKKLIAGDSQVFFIGN